MTVYAVGFGLKLRSNWEDFCDPPAPGNAKPATYAEGYMDRLEKLRLSASSGDKPHLLQVTDIYAKELKSGQVTHATTEKKMKALVETFRAQIATVLAFNTHRALAALALDWTGKGEDWGWLFTGRVDGAIKILDPHRISGFQTWGVSLPMFFRLLGLQTEQEAPVTAGDLARAETEVVERYVDEVKDGAKAATQYTAHDLSCLVLQAAQRLDIVAE